MEHILYADTEPIAIISDEDKEKTKYVHYLEVTRTVFDALFHKKTNWFVTFDPLFIRPPIKDLDTGYRVRVGDFLHLAVHPEQCIGNTNFDDLAIIGKISAVEDFNINGKDARKIFLDKLQNYEPIQL